MAADYIVLASGSNRTVGGSQLIRAANMAADLRNLVADLEANGQHQWDTGAYEALEAYFGAEAGIGADLLALLGNTKTALATSPIPEFIHRLSKQ